MKTATEEHAEVRAVFNGRVVKTTVVFENANPGIMMQHSNYFTIYYNLSKIYVKPSDEITTGQAIGQVFTSKICGESLLDFRVYKDNQKLNPQCWLAKNK